MKFLPSNLRGKWKVVTSIATVVVLAFVFLARGNHDQSPIPTKDTVASTDGNEPTRPVVSVQDNGLAGDANEDPPEVVTDSEDPKQSEHETAAQETPAQETPAPETVTQDMPAQETSEEVEPDGMKVGQVVLANWTGDHYWYPATIVKINGDRVHVHYLDDDEEEVTKDRIMPEELKVGDRVYANWKENGNFYPAKVTSRDGDSLHVVYNDGDKEQTTLAMVRVRHGDDPVTVRRVTPRQSSSNAWSYQPRRNSGASFDAQFRQYKMQQQANSYRRQAQQSRASAQREAQDYAARQMRNYRSQHNPYSY